MLQNLNISNLAIVESLDLNLETGLSVLTGETGAGKSILLDALRFALREDVNQGVRVEAFNALTNYRDEQTLAVFREQMDADSNEYIRAQSRSIIEDFDNAEVIL